MVEESRCHFAFGKHLNEIIDLLVEICPHILNKIEENLESEYFQTNCKNLIAKASLKLIATFSPSSRSRLNCDDGAGLASWSETCSSSDISILM
jgi:hypothetical protein